MTSATGTEVAHGADVIARQGRAGGFHLDEENTGGRLRGGDLVGRARRAESGKFAAPENKQRALA